jgi:hypothetical protein
LRIIRIAFHGAGAHEEKEDDDEEEVVVVVEGGGLCLGLVGGFVLCLASRLFMFCTKRRGGAGRGGHGHFSKCVSRVVG